MSLGLLHLLHWQADSLPLVPPGKPPGHSECFINVCWMNEWVKEMDLIHKCDIYHQLAWRQWHPTPVLLPGKSHGRKSLVGCGPWCRWESDTTERLYSHFSISCTGEGNGSPLQCSCLENPRDRGAWWAAVYGVAQSRTQLKRLSSISSSLKGMRDRWHWQQKVFLKHILKSTEVTLTL